jgi:lysophospholipase L1-like esterase
MIDANKQSKIGTTLFRPCLVNSVQEHSLNTHITILGEIATLTRKTLQSVRLLGAHAWQFVAAIAVVALLTGNAIADTEVTCNDTDSQGNITRTWVVRYDVRPSIYGDLVRINFLGVREPGSNVAAEFQSPNWQLIWVLLEERNAGTFGATNREKKIGSNQDIYQIPVATYFAPRIVTPDNRCTIYLRPFPYGDPLNRKLAIVGDSLTYGFSKTWEQRSNLSKYFSNFGWRFDLDAFPGRTLFASPEFENERERDMRDEIRGLVSSNPDAVVINLGTNDAVIAAGAIFREEQPLHDDIRRRMLDDLVGAIFDIGKDARCIVLVTPSDYRTPWFGLGQLYETEAKYVGNLMRFFASWSNNDKVILVDWAEIARPHHGGPDSWFAADELHLSPVGSLHMINLIGQALRTCQ